MADHRDLDGEDPDDPGRGRALRKGGNGSRRSKAQAPAKVVAAALAADRSVTAFANNHFAGYAPTSAEGLAEMVKAG
jgi:hypothetical protein